MQVYAPRDPVGEFWRGDLSLRTLRVMVEHLPPDSAMHRAHPEHAGVDRMQSLGFEQVDALNRLWELIRAANSEDSTYQPPKPLDRPWDAARRRREQAAEKRLRDQARSRLDDILHQLTGGR